MPDLTRRQMLARSAVAATTAAVAGVLPARQVTPAQATTDRPAHADPKPSPPPPIRSRMFWTWDHSTEWALNRPGAQTQGAANPYFRGAEAFVEDYTRLLAWCGKHDVDAVVVWGLLRDGHGGVDAAKRLCDVAAANKVRLLCGVGLAAYGGVYYEGMSPRSMANHLAAHPDLYALNPAGERMTWNYHACPSRTENQDHVAESIRWLFETLPGLGGMQIETGDTGVCHCARCRERRQHPVASMSWEDMALMYPMAADAARAVSPDAWIVCETYSHPEPHPDPKVQPPFGEGKTPWADACIGQFPKGEHVFVQWVGDEFVKPKSRFAWTDAGRVDGAERRNVMRAHFGTYWARKRGELAVDWIAEMVERSIHAGIDTISLFGEVSPFHTNAELNYLALENYGSAANMSADPAKFLRDVAGPLLGGAVEAERYLRLARLIQEPTHIPDAMPELHAACDRASGDAKRRWISLANYVASFAPGV